MDQQSKGYRSEVLIKHLYVEGVWPPHGIESKGYRSEVLIKHPRMDVRAELTIHARHNEPSHVAEFGDLATLCLTTGACSVQVYATAATLREIAAGLIEAAVALDLARAGEAA